MTEKQRQGFVEIGEIIGELHLVQERAISARYKFTDAEDLEAISDLADAFELDMSNPEIRKSVLDAVTAGYLGSKLYSW